MTTEAEGRDYQRLDAWLWCARFRKTRAECARQVEKGVVRINRLPTDKPHAKLRPGDVLTLALGQGASIWISSTSKTSMPWGAPGRPL